MPTNSRRLSRTRLASLTAIAALSVAAVWPGAGASEPPAATATQAPADIFKDDFSLSKGTPADERTWLLQAGNGTDGWGNKELEWYTRGSRNASQDGLGHLVITARKEKAGRCWDGKRCAYTSAKLMTATHFTEMYGHIEARIRFDVPPGRQQGFWPAFWAIDARMHEDGYPEYGEIDIMENYGTGLVQSSLHGATDITEPLTSWHTDHSFSARERNEWHVYGVDWTPTQITFTIDGRETGTRTREQFGSNWTFDRPFFLILNVAVGGTGGGNPTPRTEFPLRMLVDYVQATD
jgi:beta-glucanase (GH16 family)